MEYRQGGLSRVYKGCNKNNQVSGIWKGLVYVVSLRLRGDLTEPSFIFPVSGEGFFIGKVTGQGILFVQSLGAIIKRSLRDGEQLVVDNGYAMSPSYMPQLTASCSQ